MNATVRIRLRIKQLLDDRGMTQRAWAKKMGHGDQWASNLLAGRNALSLDQLDAAAAALGVPPSELVRQGGDAWELTPSEMRVVRAMRMLPPVVRDHLVTLADYLIGVTPEEVEFLNRIRALTVENLQVVDRWIEMKLFEQTRGPGPGPPQRAVTPPAARTRRPRRG